MKTEYKLGRLIVVLISLLVAFKATYAEGSGNNKKIHISTIGLPFFVKDTEKSSIDDYALYKIETVHQRDKFIERLIKIIKESPGNETQINMIYRILSVRNYDSELVYIVMSPTVENVKIEQPYYYKGAKELIFESGIKDTKNPYHLYIRSYVVDTNKDKFIKKVTVNGSAVELASPDM